MQSPVPRRHFIKYSARAVACAAAAKTLGFTILGCDHAEFDLVIIRALLYDGSGGKPFRADIGIRSEQITAIGDLRRKTTKRTINAGGLAVSPGFIDVHTHTDLALLVNPKAESKIRQGVTCEISGNCGDSPFPVQGPETEKYRSRIEDEYGIQVDWTDTDGFLSRLERKGIAFNYMSLIGHGALRNAVVGLDNRRPSSTELQQMKRLLAEAMEQGAIGMSTGLEYTPGSYAETDEIIELSRVAAEKDGIYATHIRNEDVRVEEALEEALHIAKVTGVKLQISHLKASQKRNWHKMPILLERISQAGSMGIRVHADRYTYTAYGTTLQLMFPMWTREGTDEDFVNRLKDKEQWKRIRPFLEDKVAALGSWESVLITRVPSEGRKHYQGQTVARLSVDAVQDPYEFVRRLLIEENGDVSMCGFGMSEENTEHVLSFPLTMVGSDGQAVAPYGIFSKTNPHPRYYGTFPRYLGYYVRQRKILTLQEAIRRITSMPAEKFKIKDRGQVKVGYYADLVVFNPETVIDKATFSNPHQYPEGIEYVIVNGEVVVDRGEHSEKLSGKVLRRV